MKTTLLLALLTLALLATPAQAQKEYYCPQTDVMLEPLVKTSFSASGDLRCDYGLERYNLKFLCNTYNGRFADDARVTKTGKLRCVWKEVK